MDWTDKTKSRTKEDQDFIHEVCQYVLNTPVIDKEPSDDFAFILVEGRPDAANHIEEYCALRSAKAFSSQNYPIFVFLNNDKDFIGYEYGLMNKWRINIIKVPPLLSLEDYTNFCIKDLYYLLPNNIERVITMQSDGFLLKNGWEKYILNNDFDWISSHWKHYAQIELFINNTWIIGEGLKSTCIGNGGFSFRKASKMRAISDRFKDLRFREYGRNDNRIPMEDLFYTYLGFNSDILKIPTLKQCDEFSVDPLTLDIWNNKEKLPFGFHFFKTVSEFPPCNHD